MQGVIVADIKEKAAIEAAEKSKNGATNPDYRAVAVTVDVTDEASVQRMIDIALNEFGRVDYGVNSAGVGCHTL